MESEWAETAFFLRGVDEGGAHPRGHVELDIVDHRIIMAVGVDVFTEAYSQHGRTKT